MPAADGFDARQRPQRVAPVWVAFVGQRAKRQRRHGLRAFLTLAQAGQDLAAHPLDFVLRKGRSLKDIAQDVEQQAQILAQTLGAEAHQVHAGAEVDGRADAFSLFGDSLE